MCHGFWQQTTGACFWRQKQAVNVSSTLDDKLIIR